MTETQIKNWQRFQASYFEFPEAGLALDLSHIQFPSGFLETMQPRFQVAFKEMRELEAGAIANPDENRMVGHYWLRDAAIAPSAQIRESIEDTISGIENFASKVHSGDVCGAGGRFTDILLIGIGGSALGPQFVANALSHPDLDKMQIHFFDNTDPDGMQRVISRIGSRLGQTLSIVISKSGGTKETRNGMLEAKAGYERAGLTFAHHALAVTQKDSELDRLAHQHGWIARFPMWDWVGGRTSQTSAVGLLPAALQGFSIRDLLSGAAACDRVTREQNVTTNPAALLAAVWFSATNGKGEKNMVVLPYKDRLELFAKYLQQLIMESIGKRLDRDGIEVHQGITVLGNKGATDQHSYIQQLRDGLNDFFAIFIEVLTDGPLGAIQVEKSITSGDYLHGFYLGTRAALSGGKRDSLTITIDEVSARSVGALIALFERAVGLYASLINVNAYHQPGVEAGKVAAGKIIQLQLAAHSTLQASSGNQLTVSELSEELGSDHSPSDLFKVCCHLASNPDKSVKRIGIGSDCRFVFVG